MNFQGLGKVEDNKTYLDVAVSRANKKASSIRDSKKRLSPLFKSRDIERAKVDEMRDSLTQSLKRILESFPSIEGLDEFYQELIRTTLDYVLLKRSLGSVSWAITKIRELHKVYIKRITGSRRIPDVNKARQEFYGRVSSVLRQISKNLKYLDLSRRTMRAFPSIKTSLTTVAIAGFPNVGKTTLLSKITSSTPEINSYAFTTKGLNLGYAKMKNLKIQFIDTPGTLNRLNKMNSIEKQAHLAMKYVTDIIIYIFDLTESYPLADQEKLFKRIKEYDLPEIIYLSKTDLLDKDTIGSFKKKHPKTKIITDASNLQIEILKAIKKI